MEILNKIKAHWGITSNWQVAVIMIVFAITGFSALYARKFLFPILGIEETDPFWFKTVIWLLTIFPLYNIFLITYGTIFGQFDFFWNFLKKMMGRFIPGKSGS